MEKPKNKKNPLGYTGKLATIAFKITKFNKALRSASTFEEARAYSKMSSEDLQILLDELNQDLDTYINEQQLIGRARLKIEAYNTAVSKKQNSGPILKTLWENLQKETSTETAEVIIELPLKG